MKIEPRLGFLFDKGERNLKAYSIQLLGVLYVSVGLALEILHSALLHKYGPSCEHQEQLLFWVIVRAGCRDRSFQRPALYSIASFPSYVKDMTWHRVIFNPKSRRVCSR